LLGSVFRERMRASMRIPAIEKLFPAPWTAAARRVLPSPSPQRTATAMWGPVLGWCVLELLAESIDAENPERVALDLFDRLRLRAPFAQAFSALGFEEEEGWRAAARIKVLLLSEAGVGKPEEGKGEVETAGTEKTLTAEEGADAAELRAATQKPVAEQRAASEPSAADEEKVALLPELWVDPDVRWLTGVHEAQGRAYLIREPYEELLWWLLMPSLLRLSGEAAFNCKAAEEMSKTVEEALATAEAAGYRFDALLGRPAEAEGGETMEANEAEVQSQRTEPEEETEPEGPPIHGKR
jgi:hypothetical protein